MVGAEKWIDWEIIPGGHGGAKKITLISNRAKVPGGWLIYICDHGSQRGSGGWGHGGLTFYPDPKHKWDGISLP